MNEVANTNAPNMRLPYHPQLLDKFGISTGQWAVLIDAIFPTAKNTSSIVLALNYCRARNLDIFKKPVQIVPIWNSALGKMVDTVWPGISEIRTTASRTGNYAGNDAAEFGPDITEEINGRTITYPEWCAVTVYRIVAGVRCPFVGPKVYWKETYAITGGAKKDPYPNAMWAKRPKGQLEKCAEAAALRRAFPEELGNEYAAEEMEGQHFKDIEVAKTPTPDPFAEEAEDDAATTEEPEDAVIEEIDHGTEEQEQAGLPLEG